VIYLRLELQSKVLIHGRRKAMEEVSSRGERLIKRGDGWFSTKAILVVEFRSRMWNSCRRFSYSLGKGRRRVVDGPEGNSECLHVEKLNRHGVLRSRAERVTALTVK